MTQRQFVNAYQRGDASADELATILRRYEELSEDTLWYVLKTDSVRTANRFLDEGGLTASRLDELIENVKKLNGENGGDGYLLQFLESGKRFTLKDVDFAEPAANGDEIYLISTNKWSSGTTFD